MAVHMTDISSVASLAILLLNLATFQTTLVNCFQKDLAKNLANFEFLATFDK